MRVNKKNLDLFISRSTAKLESEFSEKPYCKGELSSSALSTAVSCLTLKVIDSIKHDFLITNACRWIVEDINDDGGWGDTTDSPSNLSTTLLCWASLNSYETKILNKVEDYIKKQVGSLDPEEIVRGLTLIYGKDKTFAVPICMALAISGRLGKDSTCWKWVSSLPFELAAVPQCLYQYTNMSVVSYAIPALISIGIVKHKKDPVSPPLSWIRDFFIKKCLSKLKSIQPSNGGFLEAVPLTGFTAMALSIAGVEDQGIVKQAEGFLIKSVRKDGSSPIDTNLSLWLTSLSLVAVAGADTKIDKTSVGSWLCEQQTKTIDPYAGGQAGAWPWTPLPGGVPDSDDTSAALIALLNTGCERTDIIDKGIEWLLDIQNKDGGVPTFCRGWGQLPFDQSCSDITAHAIRVFNIYQKKNPNKKAQKIGLFRKKALVYLESMQRGDGSWVPLWFGSQAHTQKENPVYGTSKVLLALDNECSIVKGMKQKGFDYLLNVQAENGSFGGFKNAPSSIEETALALKALSESLEHQVAANKAMNWLMANTNNGKEFKATPIGLYFASLWYSEKLYPLIFSLDAALSFKKNNLTIFK